MVTLTNAIKEITFFPESFSCTHRRTCVYGRYAPELIAVFLISFRDSFDSDTNDLRVSRDS